jgi:hypothetical protein
MVVVVIAAIALFLFSLLHEIRPLVLKIDSVTLHKANLESIMKFRKTVLVCSVKCKQKKN